MLKVVYKSPFYSQYVDLIMSDNPYRTYNSDEYEIVPRKDFIEKQIKDREALLKRMREQKDSDIKKWDNAIELIEREIEQIKDKKA